MISFYAVHKAEVWTAVILLTLIFCVVHYLCFGPRRSESKNSGFVRRFGTAGRIFHWATMITFQLMIITGMMQVLGGDQHDIGPFHGHLGALLFVLFLIDLIFWSRDALFKAYDLLWLKSMGGYLSRSKVHLPAGRFNAGQKMYFWLMLLSLIALVVSFVFMEHGDMVPTHRRLGKAFGGACTGCWAALRPLSLLAMPTFPSWPTLKQPACSGMEPFAAVMQKNIILIGKEWRKTSDSVYPIYDD